MRIIRVEHGGTSYYGILEDGLVFRLHQQPGHMEPIPLSEAKVLPLVTPSKVVCVGLNYKAHAEELGYPLPNMPSFFLKPPSSIIGNGEPIVLPSGMGRIEHEAELAMVVGKVCRNLTPEEAEESLFGFTCANDVTAARYRRSIRSSATASPTIRFVPSARGLRPSLRISTIFPSVAL